jgi:hypothetical protein
VTRIRLALDENVSHPLASMLRSLGYDADSASELGRLQLRDPLVLAAAVDAGQTVVTHNLRDFALLQEDWHPLRRRWESEAASQAGRPLAFSGHRGILMLPHVANAILAPAIASIVDGGRPLADRLFVWSQRERWVEVTF